MGTTSKGPRHRTREKFRGPEKMTVNRMLGTFKEGERVAVKISSNSNRGMPFKRFHGRTGTIKGKKGACFIVKLRDGNMMKEVIAGPEHLKRIY
jgi:large subunit ribosomal protein L21e